LSFAWHCRPIVLLRAFGTGLLAWATMSAEATADSCGQALAVPEVSVRTELHPVSYDFSKGILAITSDPQLAIPRGLEEFSHAIGATRVVTSGQWNLSLEGQPRSDGGICWSAKSLDVNLIAHTSVFVAREIVRDTCLWREVMRHEALHVALDQRLFPRLADIVRPRVKQAAARTIAATSGQAAQAEFEALIGKAIADGLALFSAKRNKQQLTIDTREEYSRANRLCGDAEIAAAFEKAGIR